MPIIAGHRFEINPLGQRTCDCGKRWVHVAAAMRTDIGQPGFAHIGSLLEAEYDQIDAERNRIWGHVVNVASSPNFSPVASEQDADVVEPVFYEEAW
jgi:hypothetical protein